MLPRFIASLLLLFVTGTTTAAQALSVYASVPPIAKLAQDIGGPHIRVRSLLRSGDNPVTFSPPPRQLADLSDSQLLLTTGIPFEHAWLPRIHATYPGLEIIDLRQGIDTMEAAAHRHEGGTETPHADGESDPHIWTDPVALVHMSETIRDTLARLDPAHAGEYHQRQLKLAARLQQLDQGIRRQLAPYSGRSFLVFHPAWSYFAKRYGLLQRAIEHEGKQSSARWMTQLIELARREGIHLILVQPQFDQRLATQIAHAIDGRIATLDPLAPDYAKGIRQLADLIAEDLP